MRNQIIGKAGEEKASDYLNKLGYSIVCKNYKVKSGEVDLIAVKDTEILFVEVKTRTNNSFGDAIESFPKKRIERLFSASQEFISNSNEFEMLEQKFYLIAIDSDMIKMIQIEFVD